MPKKRSSISLKPSSPAHPSLSSSSKDTWHTLTSTAPSSNSVNDRLQQLRLEQKPARSKPFEAPPSHTVHPSLRAILQVPDVPPPRPRPGLRVIGARRGPAGPAPPSSWLERSPTKQRNTRDVRSQHAASAPLPGYNLPLHSSLLEMTLKEMATDWDFHVEYNQYFLATIPVRYKELLLRYIAMLSPHGIDRSGLETLFLDETELEDATGAEDLVRLDFSTSIGRSLSLKEIKLFFTPPLQTAVTASADASSTSTVPESWDANLPPSPSLPRFHSITHLSLSNPPPNISWSALLTVLPHLPQGLTHLSLAFWPLPTLTPNSLTAYTTTPSGTVQAGASSFYTAYDNDWTESASILRRVAKTTLCLQWLDLTGCWPWMQALAHDAFDWGQLWAALDTLVVGQGWVPESFSRSEEEEEEATTTTPTTKRRWREAYHLDITKPGKEVVAWASVEASGLRFEKAVRARIAAAIMRAEEEAEELIGPSSSSARSVYYSRGDAAPGGREGRRLMMGDEVRRMNDDDDWSAGRLPGKRRTTTAGAAAARKSGMRFERGWDAAWIKEAVTEIDRRQDRGLYVPGR